MRDNLAGVPPQDRYSRCLCRERARGLLSRHGRASERTLRSLVVTDEFQIQGVVIDMFKWRQVLIATLE